MHTHDEFVENEAFRFVLSNENGWPEQKHARDGRWVKELLRTETIAEISMRRVHS